MVAPPAGAVATFAEDCEAVIAIHAGSWEPAVRNEENCRGALRDNVLRQLGASPVDSRPARRGHPATDLDRQAGDRPVSGVIGSFAHDDGAAGTAVDRAAAGFRPPLGG